MKKEIPWILQFSETELDYILKNTTAPERGSRDRIKKRLKQKISSGHRSRIIPILAAILVLAALSAGVVATYQKWGLQKPETYQGDTIYVEDTQHYQQGEIIPESDAEWITRAEQILAAVDITDYDKETITVNSVVDQQYDRKELEVLFKRGKNEIATVRFHQDTGNLLGISTLDMREGDGKYGNYETASARALEFYQRLPVPQGYELRDGERYDDWYWNFNFCRKVADNLWSYYECVRIGINPQTGAFASLNVFDTPLLDDHAEGETEISSTQADEIARRTLEKKFPAKQYELESAERVVVKPNYLFLEWIGSEEETQDEKKQPHTEIGTAENNMIHYRDSEVTRLAYQMTYRNPNSDFTDKIRLDIDLYTGELIGGDMTK